jgi:hypothetical protein
MGVSGKKESEHAPYLHQVAMGHVVKTILPGFVLFPWTKTTSLLP